MAGRYTNPVTDGTGDKHNVTITKIGEVSQTQLVNEILLLLRSIDKIL